MVRINLISPSLLSDQHLIAEKNEIGMLFGYVRKYPQFSNNEIPSKFTLGKGHIKFFKNKLGYLKERYYDIRKEMWRRNFNVGKDLDYSIYSDQHMGAWKPEKEDYMLIIDRIGSRLLLKPRWYRYKKKPLSALKARKMIKDMKNLYL